jgi:hypothetical protein
LLGRFNNSFDYIALEIEGLIARSSKMEKYVMKHDTKKINNTYSYEIE